MVEVCVVLCLIRFNFGATLTVVFYNIMLGVIVYTFCSNEIGVMEEGNTLIDVWVLQGQVKCSEISLVTEACVLNGNFILFQ